MSEAKAAIEEYVLEELLDWPTDELVQLDPKRLASSPPYVIADFLERLNVDQRRTVLRKLNETLASDILSEMDAEESAEVVGAMREFRAVKIIEELDPDDATDMLGELDEEDRERLLKIISPRVARTLRNLLQYEPDTAGGVMNPDVATVHPHHTVDEAIGRIRQLREELENIFYIYVVDDQGKLLGSVKMRDLILASPDKVVETIMTSDLKGVCTPDQDREEVAHLMAELNFHALPVVSVEGKLLGLVSHDDVIDILHAEATEDMQILVGAGADESIHDNVPYAVTHRAPWLLVNLLTASIAAAVISFFENDIQNLPLLAILMPIVAGIGGNTGQQSLAVAIRGIALNEIHPGENLSLSLREALKGLVNGLLIGLVTAGMVWGVTGHIEVAGVILLAMLGNTCLAGFVGAYIPLMLKRFGIDPAQSASIFLTGTTDTAGFLIFLLLASVLIL